MEVSENISTTPKRTQRYGKMQRGVVAKLSANKTVAVKVTRQVRHSVFHKIVRRTTTFLVHDEKNECRLGDTVQIIETRPISKHKRWRLNKIISSEALQDI